MTQDYYGTKRVTAWRSPKADQGDAAPQDGYAVKYEDGYISWSPKDVFETAYQPLDALSFGHALVALQAGKRVARAGWNGKGMFLYLVPGSQFTVNRLPLLGIYPEGTVINYHAHIDMKTANGDCVPWLASQTDMLANDWTVIES